MGGTPILGVVAAHTAARKARVTMNELQRLNDRELEDIGLTRGDVDLMDITGSRRLPAASRLEPVPLGRTRRSTARLADSRIWPYRAVF